MKTRISMHLNCSNVARSNFRFPGQEGSNPAAGGAGGGNFEEGDEDDLYS